MSYPPDHAELAALRAKVAELQTDNQHLRYERHLLAVARATLDQVVACAPDRRPHALAQAAEVSQRIVDEIGHPVTDEPALGPWYRTALRDIHDLASTGEKTALQRIAAIAFRVLATPPAAPPSPSVPLN